MYALASRLKKPVSPFTPHSARRFHESQMKLPFRLLEYERFGLVVGTKACQEAPENSTRTNLNSAPPPFVRLIS